MAAAAAEIVGFVLLAIALGREWLIALALAVAFAIIALATTIRYRRSPKTSLQK
jgi:hypothetical protein